MITDDVAHSALHALQLLLRQGSDIAVGDGLAWHNVGLAKNCCRDSALYRIAHPCHPGR